GGEAHPLDALEHAHDALASRRSTWREREPAVAHHHRRDSLPAGGRQGVVPADLRVVVRVWVDEPRAHRQPRRADLAPAGAGLATHLGQTVAVDRDVAGEARVAAAVEDDSLTDDEVVWHV